MGMTRLGGTNADGLVLEGTPGRSPKRREARIARRVSQVFALREQGTTVVNIAKTCHMSHQAVESILHDPDLIRRRLTSYNEQLRAATPKAIRVVHEVLDSTAPQMLGERARMAQWVLESTKTVGKESPVNVFIRGGDTNINLSNDTLEAARAVAAAMRGAVEQKALPENVIDAEVMNVDLDGPTSERTGIKINPNGDVGGEVDRQKS